MSIVPFYTESQLLLLGQINDLKADNTIQLIIKKNITVHTTKVVF